MRQSESVEKPFTHRQRNRQWGDGANREDRGETGSQFAIRVMSASASPNRVHNRAGLQLRLQNEGRDTHVAAIVLSFAAIIILHASCKHVDAPPIELPRTKSGVPVVSVQAPVYVLPRLRIPDIDLTWFDADDFVPPGAGRIRPNEPTIARTNATPKAKYPSTEECVAMDNNAVVGIRSEKLASTIQHELLLFRRGDESARSVFRTNYFFEVLWSQDSRRIAISNFVGHNTSEVWVLGIQKDEPPSYIDVRHALAPYFSEAHLQSPCFNKAYRWSDGSRFVVRGVGRVAFPPFEQFGYEVLVDSEAPDDIARLRFLGGYVRRVIKK